MNITMSILANELKKLHPELHYIQYRSRTSLKGVRLLNPATVPLTGEYIYLCHPSDLTDPIPQNICFMLMGENDDLYTRFSQSNYIHVPDTQNITLFQAVQQVFDRYHAWYNRLLEAVVKGKTIQELLDISYDIFQNPMFVINEQLITLASSKQFPTSLSDMLWTSLTQSGYMDPSCMKELKQTNSLKYFESLQEPVFFTHPNYTYRDLAVNIRIDNKRIAMLHIFEVDTALDENFFLLANTLAQSISALIQQEISSKRTYGTLYNKHIADLLLGKAIDTGIINHQLQLSNWQLHDPYMLLAVQMQETELANNAAPYYCYLLNQIFAECQLFAFEQDIILLLNQNNIIGSFETILTELTRFLDQHQLNCGMSLPFNNILKSKNHLTQARFSLTHGLQHKNKKRLYRYEDCMVDHIFDEFCTHYGSASFLHPAIVLLAEHDHIKDTNLVDTLYTYLLNDRSLQICAQKLFIHRSTFVYRIQKITSMIKVDLDDEETKFSLLTSIRLYKRLQSKNTSVT